MKDKYFFHKKRIASNQYFFQSGAGFTLLEMLVVVGIMAMFYLLVIANFGNWRGPQNLRIAQNELSSHLQKARTFSLSGRRISDKTAKFYAVKLNTTSPRSYVLQGIAVDTASGLDVVFDDQPGNQPNIETVPLSSTVYIKSFEYFKGGVAQVSPTCVQIAFALPYGRTYITPNCDLALAYKVPSALNAYANSTLKIHLGRTDASEERIVTVYGVSGRVE